MFSRCIIGMAWTLSWADQFYVVENFSPYLIKNRSCARTCLSPDLFSAVSDQMDFMKNIAISLSHLF